jgi:hypothetical protein
MGKREYLEDPETAQWDLTLTFDDYNKMLKGFTPERMEQKWQIIADAPDTQGNTVIHFFRSWTQIENISLTIKAGDPDKTEVKDWATIVEISWLKQPGYIPIEEEKAKRMAVNLSNNFMDCELEA